MEIKLGEDEKVRSDRIRDLLSKKRYADAITFLFC